MKKGQHIWYFREVGKKLNNHLVLEITLSLWHHEKITDTKYKRSLSTKKISSQFSAPFTFYNFEGFAAEKDVKLSLNDNETLDCIVHKDSKLL